MYISYIHLFMPLFIIPSQSVLAKDLQKPLAKTFRKTSIISSNFISVVRSLCWCSHSFTFQFPQDFPKYLLHFYYISINHLSACFFRAITLDTFFSLLQHCLCCTSTTLKAPFTLRYHVQI